MRFFGGNKEKEQDPGEEEAEVKSEKQRREDQEKAVKNAHPQGHPDDVHKNLFSL